MSPIKLLKRSEFIRNTTILMSGTTVSQILPVLFTPLISRLFSPSDFSVYAVFIGLYSILGAGMTLRYDMAIMLPKDSNKAIKVVNLCLVNSIIMASFFLIVGFFFGKNFIVLLKLETLSNWYLLLPVASFFLAVNNVLINWYNRNKQYKTISINRISRSATNTASNIVFGYAKFPHIGLILSQLISDGLSATVYLIRYYYSALNKNIFTTFNDLKAVAIEYKDFPTFTLPTTLLNVISHQLPILMLTAFFSPELSGSYFFAMRILAAPTALIGFAYSQTFFQSFTAHIQASNFDAARNFLYRSWLLLFALICVPAIIIILWGAPLFSFLFGKEWLESGAISSILIFYVIFSFLSSPTSTTYATLRMQKYSLFFGLSELIYRFSSFYLGYLMNDFYLALKILVICEVINIFIYNSVVIMKIRSMSMKVLL